MKASAEYSCLLSKDFTYVHVRSSQIGMILWMWAPSKKQLTSSLHTGHKYKINHLRWEQNKRNHENIASSFQNASILKNIIPSRHWGIEWLKFPPQMRNKLFELVKYTEMKSRNRKPTENSKQETWRIDEAKILWS